MPNRFTRVADEAVPAIAGPARHLVPLADLFLVLMLSRPATGTLRTTWVTPATRWLSVTVTVLAATALLGIPHDTWWVAVLLAFMAAGSAAVALVALSQAMALKRVRAATVSAGAGVDKAPP